LLSPLRGRCWRANTVIWPDRTQDFTQHVTKEKLECINNQQQETSFTSSGAMPAARQTGRPFDN